MKRWMLAVSLLLTLPAFADHDRDYGDDDDQGTHEVVVDRTRLMHALGELNDQLTDVMGRVRRNPGAAHELREIRGRLDRIRDALANAPDFEDSGDMQPQQAPPQAWNNPPQGGQYPPPYNPPQYAPPQPRVYPMEAGSFRNLVVAISREGFPDGKLRVLQTAAQSQYFVVAQVQQVLNQFSFPKDKLNAVRMLRGRILDMNNSVQLYASFDFPSDKQELSRIISQQ